MKWYNKDKTQMLNLDAVSAFDNSDSVVGLKIYIDSSDYKAYYGQDAEEIYKLLIKMDKKSKRQVI